MSHKMLHTQLKQHSVPHCTSSSGSGDITERATTPVPDPGDDEYWMDCSNTVPTANNAPVDFPIGNNLCNKRNKYCFFVTQVIPNWEVESNDFVTLISAKNKNKNRNCETAQFKV